MNGIKRILITPGEPAGIGPDITVQIAQSAWPLELIVIVDPKVLEARAKKLHLPLTLKPCVLDQAPVIHSPGTLSILPIETNAPVQPGKLDPANADYVLRTLHEAAARCLQKKADAIVTGPVHKGIINTAGIPFTGHTEFFAEAANVAQTVMLFVVGELRVALLTIHLPLRDVAQAITSARLRSTLSILHEGLSKWFHLKHPCILVCGLNPHAGEDGYLGREEIDIITPTLQTLRHKGFDLIGPLSADTLFTPHQLQQGDAVLAMYHDQALPLIKHIGFGKAVNMTLGLPFIRTSVDHGTALDVAGTGKADASSLAAAIRLASEVVL